MNYYETLYIIHPALESGRLKDIILSLEESLNNVGGKTISIDIWGKKRLAYLIDKQKYGTYVQLHYTGEGNCTRGFGLELEQNPNVLSYLTTLIEEVDVAEQKNDLDTQIVGQSREAKPIDGIPKSVENPVQKSENDKPDSSETKKTPEADSLEENIASVEENQKSENEIIIESDEE